MNTYLYRIDNSQTKEFYLGVRSCDCEITEDPYMGSSSTWHKAYIKANKNFLHKSVVEIFENRTDANTAESTLIEAHILDPLCVNRYIPKYYKDFMRRVTSEETKKLQSINNAGEHNPFFGKTHTSETKEKLSEIRKERVTLDSTREKLSIATSGEKNPFYGKKHNEDFKLEHSKRMKGTYTGEANAFFGKTHSEESKKLMSMSKKGVNNPKSKPISLENLLTKEIKEYHSFTQCYEENEFSKMGSFKALKNQNVYLKKYLIKYIEN